MFFRMIYDEHLAAAAYLIGCQRAGEALVVDPQRDIERYVRMARSEGLRITAVTETHIHADFLSGSREIAERTGATVYLSGEGGKEWAYEWTGSYAHRLLRDGDVFHIGNVEIRAVHTPGHTPEHLSFTVTDRGSGAGDPVGILTGDFLFVGDLGRPDLTEDTDKTHSADDAAAQLVLSLHKFESLPDFVQVWPAHGAGSMCGKALGAVPSSTIGYERRYNPALQAAKSESDFVGYILSGQPDAPSYFKRMKHENKTGPALMELHHQPQRMHGIDLLRVNTARDFLVDMRSWSAYRAGHVKGSLFHPFNRSFTIDVASMVEPEADIYLICAPDEVADAVSCLVRVGLERVRGWLEPSALADFQAEGGTLVRTKESSARELIAEIESGAVHILDVRRTSEYNEGYIRGAQNIAHVRLPENIPRIAADKPLVVHCGGGMRSAYACSFLERSGFDVTNLCGGIHDWRKENRPLVKS